jgi:hypothetical protein
VTEPLTPYAELVPVGRTARRVEWRHLPPGLRVAIEDALGGNVVHARSQGAGYTPGFASILVTAEGNRAFVKAAAGTAQRMFAEAYREEALKVAALPTGAPAARLLWSLEAEGWFALGLEALDARAPHRPWRRPDLDALLDSLELVADLMTPPPADLDLPTLAEELASFPGHWADLRTRLAGRDRLEDVADLAARLPDVLGGDTLVHTDVRDDNTLILTDGTAALCDWNFPSRGPAWVDTVLALIGPRGDGIDVEPILASRRLTAEVPSEAIDVVIAAVTGYFLRMAAEPVPSTSPHIRDHQRWQGEVCWQWLAHRRGW